MVEYVFVFNLYIYNSTSIVIKKAYRHFYNKYMLFTFTSQQAFLSDIYTLHTYERHKEDSKPVLKYRSILFVVFFVYTVRLKTQNI